MSAAPLRPIDPYLETTPQAPKNKLWGCIAAQVPLRLQTFGDARTKNLLHIRTMIYIIYIHILSTKWDLSYILILIRGD